MVIQRRRTLRTLAVSSAILLLSAINASATVVAISESDFSNPTLIVFAVDGGTWGGDYPPYIESATTFSTSAPEYFYTYDPGFSGDNILDLWTIANAGSSLDVSFAQAVNRFGFHAGTNPESSGSGMDDYNVTSVSFYSDSSFVNLFATYNVLTTLSDDTGLMFYGLASSDSFQSIRINIANAGTGGGFSPYMDDFIFESTAVPEPSTVAFVGIGLILLGMAHRSAVRATRLRSEG
jgi:hypothetical protein